MTPRNHQGTGRALFSDHQEILSGFPFSFSPQFIKCAGGWGGEPTPKGLSPETVAIRLLRNPALSGAARPQSLPRLAVLPLKSIKLSLINKWFLGTNAPGVCNG